MVAGGDITEVLQRLSAGDRAAYDQLLPLVYNELRGLADYYMRAEQPGHILEGTALVHEAYLKLVDQTRVHWRSRGHFMGVAAQAMRRILVDHARAQLTRKRGRDHEQVPLDDEAAVRRKPATDLLALDEALTRFAEQNPEGARIVELLHFGGLTAEEAADVLELSSRTVERKWRYARAWLARQLEG